MITSFNIKENPLKELKDFIRTDLPSARFKYNPDKNGDTYRICLELEVEDGNKLSLLENKWYQEDNPVKQEKKNIFQKLFGL